MDIELLNSPTDSQNKKSIGKVNYIDTLSGPGNGNLNKALCVTPQGFLAFDSVENYEKILNIISSYNDLQMQEWERTLGFLSSHTVFFNTLRQLPEKYDQARKYKNNNFCIKDELFHKIIDPLGLIQIGNYVFKATLDKGYVLEMNKKYMSRYFNELSNNNFVPSVMNRLTNSSIGQYNNIFELLDTGVTGLTAKKSTGSATSSTPSSSPSTGAKYSTSIFGAKSKQVIVTPDPTGESDVQYRIKAKAVYQEIIFYFSLFAKMKYSKGRPHDLGISSGVYLYWNHAYCDMTILQNPTMGYETYCTYFPKGHSPLHTTSATINHKQHCRNRYCNA